MKILYVGLISLVLTVLLLSQTNLSDLALVTSYVNYNYLVVAFCLYVLSYILRTCRFYFLLGKRVKFYRMFNIVSMHNLANMIIPARVGEVSFLYLNKRYGITSGESLGSLITARVFDLAITSVFVVISIFFVYRNVQLLNGILLLLGLVFGLIAAAFVLLFRYKKRFLGWFDKITKILKMNEKKHVKIFKSRLIEAYQLITNLDKGKIKTAVLTSVALWLILYLVNFAFLLAFNVTIGFMETIFMISVLVLLPLIPFYGLGGFGTFEITLSFFLILFGISKEIAIISSFGIHIIILMFIVALGITSMALSNTDKHTLLKKVKYGQV
jgi:uncharacterized protein (TIRG00374 family)